MIIYGSEVSTLCAKVFVVAAAKGIKAEWQSSPGENLANKYKNIIWNINVPTLVDGKFVLSESDVIAEYLEESYPQPTLLPGDAKSRAYVRYFSRYHDLYIEPLVRKLFGQVDPRKQDMDVILPVVEQLHFGLTNLEKIIKPQPYLASGSFSLADSGFPATLMQAEAILDLFGMKPKPLQKIAKWQKTVEKHPAVKSVMKKFRRISIAEIDRKLNMFG